MDTLHLIYYFIENAFSKKIYHIDEGVEGAIIQLNIL